MSVLIEAASVIVRKKAIEERLFGGLAKFQELVPNNTYCEDDFLVRVGFMSIDESKNFIELLETYGLRFLVNERTEDITYAQQGIGFTYPCDWAECFQVFLFEPKKSVMVCKMIEDESDRLGLPNDWKPADLKFASEEDLKTRYVFMRTEGNLDVYFDVAEQKIVYRGKTDL